VELGLLKKAKKFDLELRVHLPDFIQKDRTLVGQLEAAPPFLESARERTLLVAEKLALKEFFRNGPAVDWHER